MIESYKFEAHYYLENNSHQLDALLRNRCEAELLAIIIEVSILLDTDVQLIATAAKEGGFREVWNVINKNSGGLSFVLAVIMAAMTTIPMLHDSEQEVLDKERTKLEIEKLKLEIKELKKNEDINVSEIPTKFVLEAGKRISSNTKITKRKSNFYAEVEKSSDIEGVGFSVLDAQLKKIFDEQYVKREDFNRFILKTNKLKPQEVEADVKIIAPVLTDTTHKWKGIYDDRTISFGMQDSDFKQQVVNDHITFQNGSSIICVLSILREVDEVGEIKITGYDVKTVLGKRDGGFLQHTAQGKTYRQAKKFRDNQGDLFA
jgi:hypothetical protein